MTGSEPSSHLPSPGRAGDGTSATAAASAAPASRAEVSAQKRNLPLSFAQERLWFIENLSGPSATYNISHAVHLHGRLNRAALERALDEVVARHEALRTTFEPTGEGQPPTQVVHAPRKVSLPRSDLGSVASELRAAEALRLAREIVQQPFDLVRGPLLRAHLYRLGAEDHLLVLVVHHIVFDGSSVEILDFELKSLYADFASGRPASLPPAGRQFGDYTLAQRQEMNGEPIARGLAFWRNYLEGAPPMLPLPTDYEYPATRSFRGDSVAHELDTAVVASLHKLARSERATLFHVLLAGWTVVLGCHSGEPDVVLGTPVSNRETSDNETVVGFMVNTLPLRPRLEAGLTVRQAIRQVRDSVLRAMDHSHVPFERLVQEINPPRTLAHTPLFQVLVAFQHASGEASPFHDLESWPVLVDAGVAKFDLTLWLTEADGALRTTLEYATDLFSRERPLRMLAHFAHLLGEMVARPDATFSDLNVLSSSERRDVLVEWNPVRVDYPREATIPALFADQVASTPAATALVLGEQRLSYAQLDQRANQLAHHLRQLGVQNGARVVLHLERSVEFVISVLAVLKAGAVYVPVNPDDPAARLQFVIEDAGASIALTRDSWPQQLDRGPLQVVSWARDLAAINACPADEPLASIEPTDVAYLMYTSGSTGRPKGVAVPHRAVVRLVRGQDYAPFESHERFLLLAPPSFDASTFELWGPLLNGAACVIFPGRWPDLHQLAETISAHGVTCVWLTAGLFNQIVDQRPEMLEGVRHVIAGGEPLSVAHVRRALEVLPELQLTNGYGPTESTTFACTHRIDRASAAVQPSIPIGRPINHTRCYILDPHQNPLPVGAVGELHIGGDGLARGYWNQPELTAEKFIADPFSEEPEARLYRTGDRCRWRTNGTIEFVGRLDEQVKLRGFRVEPGEIESVLREHPDLNLAVVVVREESARDKRLVAYVQPRADRTPDLDALKRFLRSRLPEYMLPSAIVGVDAFPLTSRGKIDRPALAARAVASLPAAPESHGPAKPAEVQLAALWSELLRAPQVAASDNFFDLGGHSLLAMRLIEEIRKSFHVVLPLSEVFAAPTLATMAARISRTWVPEVAVAAAPFRGSGPGTPLFHIPSIAGYEFLPPAVGRHLQNQRPFYDGLHYRGVDGLRPPAERIELIASDLITQIRAIRPRGPYFLSGFCVGGLVAYEIARQLKQAGETVAGLVMWDSFPRRRWRRRSLWKGLFAIGRHLATLPPSRRHAYFSTRREFLRARFTEVYRGLTGREKPLEGAAAIDARIRLAAHRAYLAYDPGPYEGRTLLVSTPQERIIYESSLNGGWQDRLIGPVEMVQFVCDHLDLVSEPIVSELAERMATFLTRADPVARKANSISS